jgi:chromate transporter
MARAAQNRYFCGVREPVRPAGEPSQAAPGREAGLEISLAEATRVWAKIGLLSFGGPAGQVALMHRELVEQRKWVDEERFLHALNYCMLLPGPEATQLATYIGWLMHRTRGGLVAGSLFVLPGFVAILLLSLLYGRYAQVSSVHALFFGLKAAVLAIVLEALLRIARRALKTRLHHLVAGASFLAIHLLHVPFPLIILAAGAIGFVARRTLPEPALTVSGPAVAHASLSVIERMAAEGRLGHTQPSHGRTLRVLVLYLVLWALPVLFFGLWLGRSSVFVEEGVFFAKVAVVTFGGAYSVLSYITEAAVQTYHWLTPGEMLDGLGLAESTPGPLIMVVQFVAFLGALRNPGPFAPVAAAVIGSCITVWVTFVPCFLWIFLGAPYIEALRANRSLQAALSSITAAVVGVVLNLSLWFTLHVLFREHVQLAWGPLALLVPVAGSIDPLALGLTILALLAVFALRASMPITLAGCAALGVLLRLVWPAP